MFKFILAALGYFFLGRNFFGVIAGFVVGSFIDNFISPRPKGEDGESVFDYYKQQAGRSHEDFPTMLMALSASVMKADGRTLKVELEYIKSFFATPSK